MEIKGNGKAFPRFAAIAIAVVLMFAGIGAVPFQEGIPERYFYETGHSVRGLFFTFFNKNGGVSVFGYPITGEFIEPKTQHVVQYFQNARFEYHPENPPAYQIQLGLIGDELKLYAPRVPQIVIRNCEYFPQTGHNVCDSFLTFFKANGGVDVFGYPITEYKVENDRIVQVFQRMRLEWYSELDLGRKIKISTLGIDAFRFQKLDPDLLNYKALPNGPIEEGVTSLNARATVSPPIADGNNIGAPIVVSVFVKDQQGNPVNGALVVGIARLSSGYSSLTFPPTDRSGMTQTILPKGQTKAGQQVSVDITVAYLNLLARTRASFLPWW